MTRLICVLVVNVTLFSGCVGEIGSPHAEDSVTVGDPTVEPVVDDQGVPLCSDCAGSSTMLRLTRLQYARSVELALGSEVAAALDMDRLPSDGRVGPFATNGELNVNTDEVALYEGAAETVGEAAAAAPEVVLNCEPVTDGCVANFVAQTGALLFRRPLEEEERSAYGALYALGAAGGSPSEGLRVLVSALLQSPWFLYRVEMGVDDGEAPAKPLSQYEIAARLSFFLWRSGPDAELLAAAEAKELDWQGIAIQARRMLMDARADVTLAQFHREWLEYGDLGHKTLSDDLVEFEPLRSAMLEESDRFVVDVFRNGGALAGALLTSNTSLMNNELAQFYGVEAGPDGRVDFGEQRTGLLMHASVLTAHTAAPRTTPIYRGLTVFRNVLCVPLPDPPDDIVPGIPDETDSMRDQLTSLTDGTGCAGCHNLMNPTGLAFGNFDQVGRYREVDEAGHAIDASGRLTGTDVDGDFSNGIELVNRLADSDSVHSCLVRQWTRFALERGVTEEDEASLVLASRAYEESGRDLRELIVAIAPNSVVPAPCLSSALVPTARHKFVDSCPVRILFLELCFVFPRSSVAR